MELNPWTMRLGPGKSDTRKLFHHRNYPLAAPPKSRAILSGPCLHADDSVCRRAGIRAANMTEQAREVVLSQNGVDLAADLK